MARRKKMKKKDKATLTKIIVIGLVLVGLYFGYQSISGGDSPLSMAARSGQTRGSLCAQKALGMLPSSLRSLVTRTPMRGTTRCEPKACRIGTTNKKDCVRRSAKFTACITFQTAFSSCMDSSGKPDKKHRDKMAEWNKGLLKCATCSSGALKKIIEKAGPKLGRATKLIGKKILLPLAVILEGKELGEVSAETYVEAHQFFGVDKVNLQRDYDLCKKEVKRVVKLSRALKDRIATECIYKAGQLECPESIKNDIFTACGHAQWALARCKMVSNNSTFNSKEKGRLKHLYLNGEGLSIDGKLITWDKDGGLNEASFCVDLGLLKR